MVTATNAALEMGADGKFDFQICECPAIGLINGSDRVYAIVSPTEEGYEALGASHIVR
jgi:hypothetical protein